MTVFKSTDAACLFNSVSVFLVWRGGRQGWFDGSGGYCQKEYPLFFKKNFASPIFTCIIHFIPTIFTEEQMDKKPLVSNYVVSWEIWKFPAAVNQKIDRDFLII